MYDTFGVSPILLGGVGNISSLLFFYMFRCYMNKITDIVNGVETLKRIQDRLQWKIDTLNQQGRNTDNLQKEKRKLAHARILLMASLYCYEAGDPWRAEYFLNNWPKWRKSVRRWRTHPPF